jgi:hypothetical protein
VILRRACGRLLHVDDMLRINVYRGFLQNESAPNTTQLSARERRLLRMLVGSLVPGAVSKQTPLYEGAVLLWSYKYVREELLELLEVLAARVEHVPVPLATHIEVPLEIHARYTRVEVLAAFDVGEGAKVAPWQTGVYWAPNARADLLAFTLDKTTGHSHPPPAIATTRSAGISFIGRVNLSPVRTARPGYGTNIMPRLAAA